MGIEVLVVVDFLDFDFDTGWVLLLGLSCFAYFGSFCASVHHCGFECISLDKWTRYLRIRISLQSVELVLDKCLDLDAPRSNVLIGEVASNDQKAMEDGCSDISRDLHIRLCLWGERSRWTWDGSKNECSLLSFFVKEAYR